VAAANRVMLDATIAQRSDLRYTPAGIPVLELMLRHASTQPEAGGTRQVECDIAAIAFAEIATRLATLDPATTLRCQGFIARRYRTGASLALHISGFESTQPTQ
jgi:primosomal replication protein N